MKATAPDSLGAGRECPNCGGDLQGDPIPEKSREAYGGKAHFSRVIGVEYQGGFDGISEWQCPDCGCREGRWSGRVLADDEFEPHPYAADSEQTQEAA